jgi:DNA-binding transcriptional ArsR family regulator
MPATTNDVFAALANPTRRELLRLLLDGPQPVARMAARFEMARPSVSEHLRVLREAGLVSERRAGRQRYYQLEAGPLRELSEWLHPYEQFWRERLTGLRDLLDELAQE